MSKGLLLLSFVNLVCSQRAVDWFAINCPASTGDVSCTFRNTYNVDLAISLFFQIEDNDGSYFEVSSLLKSDQAKLANECPVNMTYSVDKSGEMYCLLTNITFPHSGVEAYCQYLSYGYEGFTYPDSSNPNYKCPDTMRFGSNNEGTDFCTYNVPSSYTLPKGAISYCSPEAFSNHELGFKWGGFTTPTPSHPYSNQSIVYCSRSWTKSQTGSAGDCYFILEKGESYNVIGKGTTNIIGAHAVKLNDKSHFDSHSNPMNINCPSSISKDCQYSNQNHSNKDVYITTSFHSNSGKMDSLSCSYLTNKGLKINVCHFSSFSADSSSSSCNFILPSNKVLSCSITNDLIVDSATMRIMDQSYLGLGEPILNNAILCPNGTFPSTTMCDCYYDNKDKENDMLVIMQSVNANNQFNSFHCYIWGINVCGWGSNSNNMDDSGGCWFILPAGASYNCSMEWGETTFTYSVMMKLNGSIYTIARNDNPNTQMSDTRGPITPIKGNKIPQSRSSDEMYILFRKWKRKFDKIYTSENEETLRFANFKQFVTLADNTKSGIKPTPFSSLNSLSDLSMTEFVDMYRGCAYPLDTESNLVRVPFSFNMDNIPTSVDWRTSGAITPVKDQGQCGSCWAFSTTGVLESSWFLAGHRPLVPLSEQDLVDCETDCYGCNGGWPYKAIEWVAKHGIDTGESYPYTSGISSGSCQHSEHEAADIQVSTYQMIENSEAVMAAYVAQYGPISISLDAMTQLWWPYSGGVMGGCCNKTPDHAVLIVGYGVTNGTEYWLIKNSWGKSWGIDGYLYLEKGTDQCGITVQPVVPRIP